MEGVTATRIWRRAVVSRYAPPILIFVVGVTLSLALFQFLRAGERTEAEGEFERRATAMARAVERDLTAHVQFIAQFHSAGEASATTDLAEFSNAYTAMIRPMIRGTLRSAPGFEATEYVSLVPEEIRSQAESYFRTLLRQDFQISDQGPDGMIPAAARPYHLSIMASDSATGPIDRAGLDLARDARQLDAFWQTAASGEMAAWPVGVWEADQPLIRYRIAAPTYSSATVPPTAAERLAIATGFNTFILRPDLLLDLALAGDDRGPIDVRVYDDALAGGDWPALIYASLSSDQQPAETESGGGLHWGTAMSFAGRTWRLEFTPGPGYNAGGSWVSWGAFAGGVTVSALIALYLFTTARFEMERRSYLTAANSALEAEIAERRQVEAALRRSEGQYRAVVEQVQEVIFQSDAGGRWTFLNPAWVEITGFSIEESLGLTALEFVQSDDARRLAEQLATVVHGTQDSLRMEVRHLTKDGGVRWLDVYACAVRDEAGALTGLSGTLADITERKEFEERLAYQAFHDPLTGLPNRAGFANRLGEALDQATAHSTVALLMLDLDGFKEVNDTYGHPAGDVLLLEVGRRLRACVREDDLVARLGGDEFTVVIEHRAEPPDVHALATRMIAALAAPVPWRGHDLAVGASIGIAVSTGTDRPDRDELVRRADIALYQAKAAGKGRARTYTGDRSIERDRRSA